MPGTSSRASPHVVAVGPGVEHDLAEGDPLGQLDERRPAAHRHRQQRWVDVGQRGGRREHVGDRWSSPIGQRRRRRRSTRRPAMVRAPRDRHLLADDGAHRGLERIDASRERAARASGRRAGPASGRRASAASIASGSASRSSSRRKRRTAGRQVAPVGEAERHTHVRSAALHDKRAVDRGDAVAVGKRQRADESVAVGRLDPGDRPGREERHHRAGGRTAGARRGRR